MEGSKIGQEGGSSTQPRTEEGEHACQRVQFQLHKRNDFWELSNNKVTTVNILHTSVVQRREQLSILALNFHDS